MPAFAPTAQDGLQVADAAKTGPRGKIPTFFYDTGKRGIPRFEDMLTIRALEKTHTVSLAMDTIKGQVASTPWSINPTVEDPSTSHEQASDMIEEFLDGRFNRNRESFDHLVKRWVGDILSIDAGILEKVPVEDGGPLAEIYVRDGASYVKAPNKHEVLPSDDDERPAYWQFPLTRDAMIRRRHNEGPLREFQEAFEGLQGYGSLFRKPIPFKREQIVWTEHSPVSWQVYGLGRVMKAKKVIEIVLHQDITNKKYFTGNELPEGIVNVIDGSKTEVQRFREYMNEEHKGREHTLAIVGGRELDYQRFRPELKDLQFLESQEWYNKLIWMLFGLSANEVGLIEDVNRSAGEVQDIVVWRKTTKPLLNLLEQEINRKILPFMEEYAAVNGEVEFSWEPEHPAVKQMKREREREDLASGIVTVNEVRRERGLEEKPWGDMPAELLKNLSRTQPEWAVEAWELTPDDQMPPQPMGQGFSLSAPSPLTKNPEGVPDDAQPIGSEGEAPEGATIHEGPEGGLYYTTGGGGDEGSSDDDPESVEEVADSIESYYEDKEFVDDFGVYDFFSAAAPYREAFDPPDSVMHESAGAFAGSPDSDDTVPLYAHVAGKTENFNVHPELVDQAGEADLSPEDETQLEQHAELTQEMIRRTDPTYDEETDTVEVYRGVAGDLAGQMARGVRSDGSVDVEHRTVESWTADPNLARAFADGAGGGVVIRKRVPVESIQTGFQSNPRMWAGDQAEAEYVVAAPPDGFTYDSDEVLEVGDLEDSAEIDNLAQERADAWRDQMEDFR